MNLFTHRRSSLTMSLAIACVFLSVSTFAQYKEWRPIAPEDIAAKSPIVESDADAEALFWEQSIDDSDAFELDIWHYVRVKVFTERGREKYSKFDIPFARGTKIKNLSARVIKTDGSMVEIGEKDIFEREIIKAGGVKVKAKSFAVPNLEPGVIVEYKFKESIDDAGASGMRLQLQRDLPVRRLSYLYKPFDGDPLFQAYNVKDVKFNKVAKGFWTLDRANVPAFKEEPRMPPENTVRPWILLTSKRREATSISAFSISYVDIDPSNRDKYWAAVAGKKASTIQFILKPNKDITATARQIVAGASNDDEMLRRLYDYCQREIKNTYYDPKITAEERKQMPQVKAVADILKRKSAPLPGYIDWLFASLAGSLGMEVRLTFTGNRSENFFEPNMTNERLLHLSAIAVRSGAGYKFFNPGDPFVPYGMMPWHDEDSWALLVGPDNFLWSETSNSNPAANMYKRSADLKLKDDGTLEGDVTIEMTGQPAITYRQSNYDEAADKLSESLRESVKARFSTSEVTNLSVENVLDTTKPLIHRYRITIPGYAQKTGKRLFLQPGFFEYSPTPVFSSSSRKYSVFFPYGWSEADDVKITLPSGYQLDNADTPAPLNDPRSISSLKINIKHDTATNTILYKRDFYFGNEGRLLFPVDSYQPLKNLFDAFHKADTHSIAMKQQ